MLLIRFFSFIASKLLFICIPAQTQQSLPLMLSWHQRKALCIYGKEQMLAHRRTPPIK